MGKWVLLVCLVPSVVRAETIRLSGRFTTLPAQQAIADLHGDHGFAFVADQYFVGIGFAAFNQCPTCGSGDWISGVSPLAEHDFQLDGRFYEPDEWVWDMPRNVFSGVFATALFRVPTYAHVDTSIIVPFTFDGDLTRLNAFHYDLIGQGLATFTFHPIDDEWDRWTFVRAQYDFANAIPNPEPSTWLLLATGVLGLYRRLG